jgi:7-cyano-7-deazaguanine reductase
MNVKDDVSSLTHLGHAGTKYPERVDPSLIETFPNRFAGREYQVTFETEEFTSLCPMTAQPDFGTITITYVPGQRCIESKSLKLYLFSYRSEPSFMETLTNRILDDLVAAVQPRRMLVTGNFRPRGGIAIVVEATYEANFQDE